MRVQVEPIDVDQSAVVQRIFEASPSYFRNTSNSYVQPHFALKEMTERPPPEKQTPTYRKVFCLLQMDGKAVGVADLHKDHPEKGHCYIGLLLLEEAHQGRGLGKILYSTIEHFIKSNLNCFKIVLGVSQVNNVEGFWKKVGFCRNGQSYDYSSEGHKNEVFEMEKVL